MKTMGQKIDAYVAWCERHLVRIAYVGVVVVSLVTVLLNLG
ncbi:hypothetical protein ACPV4B_12020 [Vibrio parahaemolyticus]